MLGRRLDRYVTSFFVWHFLLCLVAVVGLYVVVDTFTELDEFAKDRGVWEQARWIGLYHLYHIPLLLGQFLPIITLLAGIISFGRLASYNELNAMKAAGISLYRTVAPVFGCTLIIGALASANQEFLIPRLEGRIRAVEIQAKAGNVSRNLWVYEEDTRTTIEAERLDTKAEGVQVRRVEIVADPEVTPDGQLLPSSAVRAAHAVWVRNWLFLFDGHVVDAQKSKHPFLCRIVRCAIDVADFDRDAARRGRLSDGTPAHLLRGASALPALQFVRPTAKGKEPKAVRDPLGKQPLSIQFAEVELIARYRLIINGHLTASYAGEDTQPPLAFAVALWHDNQWLGQAQTYTEQAKGTPESRRQLIVYDGDPLPIHASPVQLAEKKVDPAMKSFAYLLNKARENPRNQRLRQWLFVQLHSRLAFPLANFVLLLMAIPLLFQQEGGKSTWIGVGLALLVSLCYYFFTYFCQFVGQDPHGVFAGIPALAAWLPIVVFGVGGGILFSNVNT
ncbi:MAG: LptF/LptG family permease [Candidatus Brocadiae bacterium]|nr:LptF/LptG family permease [Candidatus Brocadiia bacterium]